MISTWAMLGAFDISLPFRWGYRNFLLTLSDVQYQPWSICSIGAQHILVLQDWRLSGLALKIYIVCIEQFTWQILYHTPCRKEAVVPGWSDSQFWFSIIQICTSKLGLGLAHQALFGLCDAGPNPGKFSLPREIALFPYWWLIYPQFEKPTTAVWRELLRKSSLDV